MTTKVRLLLSYDGTDFFGWQKQKDEKRTVQQTLEDSLSRILDEPVRVIGASRTDAGVHAHYQVVHFETSKDPNRYRLIRGLNALNPRSIAVRKGWIVEANFHAIASAQRKTYRYMIWNSSTANPFRCRWMTHLGHKLDVEKLNLLSRELLGFHDFRSFQTTGSSTKTTHRTLYRLRWEQKGRHQVLFTVIGSGFLRQMVRNIVGTTLDLHFQSGTPHDMVEILKACDRRRAGRTAPPQGLHLWHIEYPKNLDKKCLDI